MYIAQSDIKDYFYSLQLPVGLRSLFSMPPVPSQLLRQLGVDTSHLPGLDPSGWVHPMLRVVPMGWSWAMWLSQRVHQFQSQLGANIGMDRVLVDGKQSPDLSTGEVLLLPYADNLNIAGTDKRRVQAAKDGAVAQLRKVGLVVHEELDATTTAQSLGFLIDGEAGRVTPIPDRIEKIRLALGWLSKRPRVSGHSIQKILGHVVHFCMLKRPLLSIPRRLYDFVTYAGHRRCRLWTGAAVEARWLRDLLPLVSADLRKPLSGVLTASDASLSGIAVCSRDVQLEDIQSLIKTKEAWRYKGRNPASRPRANVFESEQLDPFTDISTVKPIFPDVVDPYELNEEFVEVSKHLHTSEDWSLRFSQYMQFPEAITVLEGRAIVATLRHKFRSVSNFHKQHAHLCDNLGTVLAVEKGRSSSMNLLKVCRRITCLFLATSSSLSCRWIPSEVNTADAGSRQWEHLRTGGSSGKAFKCQASKKGPHSVGSEFGAAKHNPGELAKVLSPESRSDSWEKSSSEGEGSASGSEQARAGKEASGFCSGSDGSVKVQGAKFSSASSGVSSSGAGLQDWFAQVPSVCQTKEVESERIQEHRQGIRGVFERVIFHRQNLGSSGRQRARLFRQDEPPPCEEVSSRMAQAPHSLGVDSSDGSQHVGEQHVNFCTPSSSPETRRGFGGHSQGPGLPHSKHATPLHQPSPLSRSSEFKDGALRRDDSAGWGDSNMDGPSSGQTQNECKGSSAFRHGVSTFQSRLGSDTPKHRAAIKSCRPSSAQAFRAFSRHVEEMPNIDGDQGAWEVAKRLFSQALRRPCKTESGVSTSADESSKLGSGSPKTTGDFGPKVFMPPEEIDKKVWILEVFSGSAHLSRALAKAGFRVAAWDVSYNVGCDVLEEAVLSHLLRFCVDKRVVLVWFGMPWQSWSRARRWDGGPPPLRDDALQLYGRARLSSKDSQKVFTGNLLLFWTTYLFCNFLNLQSIPWVVENPFTSRCWLTSVFQTLIAGGAILHRVDFCQYHTPWRKSTGLLPSNLVGLDKMLRICDTIHGRCSATQRRHVILSGQDAEGTWWTVRAQPYPKPLCRDLASFFARAHSVGG